MTAALSWLAYDPNNVKPGWIALVLVLVLCLATYLLWRSMNTQLGKIQMPPRRRPSGFAGDSDVGDGDKDDERPPAETSD